MKIILHQKKTVEYKIMGITGEALVDYDVYANRSAKGVITTPSSKFMVQYGFEAHLAPLSIVSCIPESCIHYLRVYTADEDTLMFYDSEWIILPKGSIGRIILDIILRTFIDEYRIVSLPPKAGQIRYV